MRKTNLAFQLCPTVSVKLIPQWKLFTSGIQEREQTLRGRLWKNYAVKFPELAERLRNSSGRFSERLFQISAFRARTESIKTMVWRSKHNQPLKQNSQESEISVSCRRCGQSNETMSRLCEDCPRPKSLRARSRALQQLF